MNAIDPFEQVVSVEVEIDQVGEPADYGSANSKTVRRYVIMDTHPSVSHVAKYRTAHPLKMHNAWTFFKSGARWHKTEREATDALYELWGERMMQDSVYEGVRGTTALQLYEKHYLALGREMIKDPVYKGRPRRATRPRRAQQAHSQTLKG